MPTVHHPRAGFTGTARIGRRTLTFTDGAAPLEGPSAAWRRAGYVVSADEAPKGIGDMTVPELRGRAAEQGVDVPAKATKAELVAALTAPDSGESGDDD